MMQSANILIVDDDAFIRLSMEILLEQHFSFVKTLENPKALQAQLKRETYDVLLLDMNFKKGETEGKQGMHWLKKILAVDPHLSVIMITAYGGIEIAVEAIKAGAKDFIVKPWQNEKLLSTVRAGVQLSRSQRKLSQVQSQQSILQRDLDQPFSELIGDSQAMQRVFSDIRKVAATDANVLVLGENGTGKELVARAIHRQSLRREQVFIGVDLGAIPDQLFESELFGHKKGAFTDAREDRVGRMEAAQGGTLFLDELGNLSLPLQAKLLRALQNREIIRLGTHKPISIDFRLISATNQSLSQQVEAGNFRQDLLFRLNTVVLQLPPLRERKTDIPLLARFFLQKYTKKYQKPIKHIASTVLKHLQAYHWPGNVRELQHALERAVIMSDGDQFQVKDFFFLKEAEMGNQAPSFNLDELEKWALQYALIKHNGNVSKAAQEVGLTRGTFYRRMEKHGL